MKSIQNVVLLLFLCLTSITIGQQLPAGINLPPHWEEIYEVISYENGLLTYRDKITAITNSRYITKPQQQNLSMTIPFIEDTLRVPPLDTLYADTVLIIDLNDVDTAFYTPRFNLLGEIPVNNVFANPLVIYDFNGNGINEVLGRGITYEPAYGVFNWYYEWQKSDSLRPGYFKRVFSVPLDKGGNPLGAADSDGDGRAEACFSYNAKVRFYEADTVNGYPDTILVQSLPNEYSTNPASALYYDYDGDGKIEFHYARPILMNNTLYQHSAIWEYQLGSDQLRKTWWRNVSVGGTRNTVVGDMDNDGKNEFYFGGGWNGSLTRLGFENKTDNHFNYFWRGSVLIPNVGLSALPGDMDGDGLPEMMLQGGRPSVEGKYLLMFVESHAPDQLMPTASIAVKGSGGIGTNMGAAHGDVDGDGVHELAVGLEDWILMFKAAGNDNYELFWIKKHNLGESQITMGDVDGDNSAEIIVSGMTWNPNTGYKFNAFVYKYNLPSAILPPVTAQTAATPAQLMSGYPSPFNSSTTILYRVNQPGKFSITIYDLKGKEVHKLMDRFHVQGDYRLTWDVNSDTGKEVSSGIYFVVLRSGRFIQVQKTTYVK